MDERSPTQRMIRNLLAVTAVAALILTGFGGTVAADDGFPGPAPRPDQFDALRATWVPHLPEVEPHPPTLQGHLNAADCVGTAKWINGVKGKTEASKGRLDGLGPINNATNGLPNATDDNPLVIIFAILAVIVAIVTLLVMIEIHDLDNPPTLEWSYECHVTGLEIEANAYGGYAREVQIQAVQHGAEAGGYVDVGSPCTYEGDPIQRDCDAPATYTTSDFGSAPAGGGSGKSNVLLDSATHKPYLSPALPTSADVCIDPTVKAVNRAQAPALDLLIRPRETPYAQDTCIRGVCIQWAGDFNGCLAKP